MCVIIGASDIADGKHIYIFGKTQNYRNIFFSRSIASLPDSAYRHSIERFFVNVTNHRRLRGLIGAQKTCSDLLFDGILCFISIDRGVACRVLRSQNWNAVQIKHIPQNPNNIWIFSSREIDVRRASTQHKRRQREREREKTNMSFVDFFFALAQHVAVISNVRKR